MSKTALALQRYEIFLKQPNFTLSHVRFPPIVFSASLSQRKSNGPQTEAIIQFIKVSISQKLFHHNLDRLFSNLYDGDGARQQVCVDLSRIISSSGRTCHYTIY